MRTRARWNRQSQPVSERPSGRDSSCDTVPASSVGSLSAETTHTESADPTADPVNPLHNRIDNLAAVSSKTCLDSLLNLPGRMKTSGPCWPLTLTVSGRLVRHWRTTSGSRRSADVASTNREAHSGFGIASKTAGCKTQSASETLSRKRTLKAAASRTQNGFSENRTGTGRLP